MKYLLKFILEKLSPTILRKLRLWHLSLNILPSEFKCHLKKIKPGDIVIDIGSNIGLVSEYLAKYNVQVISFEPNSVAFKEMEHYLSKYENVKIYNEAAGLKNRKVKLYKHHSTYTSKEDLTQSSSLLYEKSNVSKDIYENVKEIDFAEFILKLNKRVELIKIDIEGYEISLINHLIDNDCLKNINKIYVELHDDTINSIKISTKELKNRINRNGLDHKFFFEWH